MYDSDLIFSNNFADKSHIIFSQTISKNDFQKDLKDNKNIVKISETTNVLFSAVTYMIKDFELKENSIIYCHADLVENLFIQIKECGFKNIKLISHQSDRPITKSLFLKKPKCISKWYGINIDFHHEDLIPIPTGLSNNISKKNLTSKYFDSINYSFTLKNKIEKIYFNFNANTNVIERGWLYKKYENNAFVDIEKKNLDLRDYKNKLSDYRYVLCPWGNGFDSHRIWETLYSGSVPIVRKHTTFNYLEQLPVIFCEDFNDINEESIRKELALLNNKLINYDILNLSWWLNRIADDDIVGSEAKNIYFKPIQQYLLIFLYLSKLKLNSVFKKVVYNFRRLKKLRKFVRK